MEKRLERLKKSEVLLNEINNIEIKFNIDGNIGARSKAFLNLGKLSALQIQESIPELEKVSKETIELTMKCYFDKHIEHIIIGVLSYISLSENDLVCLLNYLKKSNREISKKLLNLLVIQFNIKNILHSEGKKFFLTTKNQEYIDFIDAVTNNNYEEVLKFLEDDIMFAVLIANTLKNFPDLRKKIIDNLPDDGIIQKEKLQLLLNFDKKDYDEAFGILKKLDLSDLSYFECKPILQVIQKKKAWDFEVIVLQKLLNKEKNEKE